MIWTVLSWVCNLILYLLLIFVLLFIFFKYKHKYWRQRNVHTLDMPYFFGHFSLLSLTKTFGEILEEYYFKAKGHPYSGFYIFHTPGLLAVDLDFVKDVLVKDFEYFHDRGIPLDPDVDPLQAHLFSLSGKKWRNLRIKLSPTFTSGKMKMMFPTMVENGENLKRYLDETIRNNEPDRVIEMKDVLARFTTDVISSCAFGIESNCLNNPDSEFRRMGRKIFEPSLYFSFITSLGALFPKLFTIFKISRMPSDVANFFMSTVRETMEYREKNDVHRNDFMELLIQLKNKGKIDDPDAIKPAEEENVLLSDDQPFNVEQAAAQAFVFFFAGFETSSTVMMFCLYELALNLNIQKKLQDEVDKVLERYEQKLTYECVQEMGYLDKVIKETMRKYPPVPLHFRECTKAYKVKRSEVEEEFVIDKGTGVLIPVLGIHRDPEYYPEPDKFDPDRFSPEEKAKRHHYSYIPFGEGPRICIGERFGMMQTKVGLISILSIYNIDVSNQTKVPIEFESLSFVLSPKHGMPLKLSLRKKDE